MPKPLPVTITAIRVRKLFDAVTLPTARERIAAVVALLDGWHFWGTKHRAALAAAEVAQCCGPVCDPQDHATEAELLACPICSPADLPAVPPFMDDRSLRFPAGMGGLAPGARFWPRDLERRRDKSRLPRVDLWNPARREWETARPVTSG